MKRNNENVPGFDEIIFETRNKTYGAYKLRKQYKSATGISILGTIAFSLILVSALSLSTKKGTATALPQGVILVMTDPVTTKIPPPPEFKAPANPAGNINNLRPVVTEDTTEITSMLSTEEILSTLQNGNPDDTITYTDSPDPVIPTEIIPFIIVEEMPEYPGGIPALMKFVGENLIYPEEAALSNIQGKVILKFVVNADGSVDRIEVTRSIDPLLDNEAIRVVKILPKFKPGKQGGVPVPVWFSLPVNFKMQN